MTGDGPAPGSRRRGLILLLLAAAVLAIPVIVGIVANR